jgi:hypothetical protein
MMHINQHNRLQLALLLTYRGCGQVEGDDLHFLSGEERAGLILLTHSAHIGTV